MIKNDTGIVPTLDRFSTGQFYDWLYGLLFDIADMVDPRLPLGRDETLDAALLDIYAALSPQAQGQFKLAVDSCLDALPRDLTSAAALQILTQLVQFAVPPHAKDRLDSLMRTEYMCRPKIAGHSQRYWLMSARCLYSMDDELAAYMLRTARSENDIDYTSRCLSVLIKSPSKLSPALDLLPLLFAHVTSRPAYLNQVLYHSRYLLDQDGPAHITAWLGGHQAEMCGQPATVAGFKRWCEALENYATDRRRVALQNDVPDWDAFIRAIQLGARGRSAPTMDEMYNFIEWKINELKVRPKTGGSQPSAVDWEAAAGEFRARFPGGDSGAADAEAILENAQEIPVKISTPSQLHALGCWPATYRGRILSLKRPPIADPLRDGVSA